MIPRVRPRPLRPAPPDPGADYQPFRLESDGAAERLVSRDAAVESAAMPCARS